MVSYCSARFFDALCTKPSLSRLTFLHAFARAILAFSLFFEPFFLRDRLLCNFLMYFAWMSKSSVFCILLPLLRAIQLSSPTSTPIAFSIGFCADFSMSSSVVIQQYHWSIS